MTFSYKNWFPNIDFGTWRADTINGTSRSDIIFGLSGNDVINTYGGSDIVFGGDGNDIVDAGTGDDILSGDAGDDRLKGGLGSDIIDGGRGFDVAVYDGSFSDYAITTRRGATTVRDLGNNDRDSLTGVEAIYFAGDDFTFYLDGRNHAVVAGDDTAMTGEDAPLSLTAASLIANDKDYDGDTLTITGVSATSAGGAAVTLQNGIVQYNPGSLFNHLKAGETATDTFTYTVSDGRGGTDTATVTVTINGTNDAPVITSAAQASYAENGEDPVLTVAASDVDGDTLIYAISGGADASLFVIDPETGALRFANAPDFEAPADQGADNVYNVTVSASDGQGGTTSQDIAVTVTDVTETSAAPRINEIHYDNAGADTGEFVEIRVAKDADVTGLRVDLYNGSNGQTYANVELSSLTRVNDGDYDYYVWERPADGIQNGSPDAISLTRAGTVIEFLSYEGTMTASNGPAAGQTSIDIGVSEVTSTPIGQSLQRSGDGPTDWRGPEANTKGGDNDGDTGPGEPTPLLISEVQGSGTASLHQGEYVLVSAVVTYTVSNGFYLQEEMTDQDGNVQTSEGIFVFTGGAPTVAIGDLVEVAGTVVEFNRLTEITDLVSINKISSGNDLPDLSLVELPRAGSLEHLEGMRIELSSGTDERLTVIENFDLGRYGQITVSAGEQYQPTQILDPTTDAAEIAALTQANLNNRLTIDDGNSRQNPTDFRYIPATVGDNGNGYLDAGDTFGPNGPTLRLGAELTGPITGVLSEGTDGSSGHRMLVDGLLPVDQATNVREQAPADVGGELKVASFNLLNLFTTLGGGWEQGDPGSGPNNLEPRGAMTAGDLQRQLDKIVTSMLEIGADVFGLQELENNGFDSGSAIATLVNALNAKLGANVYAFVDPTGGSPDGFIGTDAITTGVIYRQDKLSVVGSDTLDYDGAGGQQLHRPSIAVGFEEIGTGERFTLAVSHFKSKGDSGVLDPNSPLYDPNGPNVDQGDGQSFWNHARTLAAEKLAQWLATDPTGSGDTDTLLLGDLNSYAQEDPVDALRDAGFIDLIDRFIGQDNAYSYIFDGQRGTLDQGLATGGLADQITGATEWHINSPEPGLFGYSSEFTDPRFYNNNPFATSDHDPLIIGLTLGGGDNIIA